MVHLFLWRLPAPDLEAAEPHAAPGPGRVRHRLEHRHARDDHGQPRGPGGPRARLRARPASAGPAQGEPQSQRPRQRDAQPGGRVGAHRDAPALPARRHDRQFRQRLAAAVERGPLDALDRHEGVESRRVCRGQPDRPARRDQAAGAGRGMERAAGRPGDDPEVPPEGVLPVGAGLLGAPVAVPDGRRAAVRRSRLHDLPGRVRRAPPGHRRDRDGPGAAGDAGQALDFRLKGVPRRLEREKGFEPSTLTLAT